MSSENFSDVRKQLNIQSKNRIAYPKRGDIALDLGVGTAASTEMLMRQASIVIGIDKNKDRLEEVHKKISALGISLGLIESKGFDWNNIRETENVILIEMDVKDISSVFGSDKFNFVDCYAAFHHFYEQGKRTSVERLSMPMEILKQIYSTLQLSGSFTLFDPVFSKHTRDVWEEMIAIREEIHREGDGQFYTEEELHSMLKETGFKIRDIKKGVFPRSLEKWIRGGIETKDEAKKEKEKILRESVIAVFEKDEVIKRELNADKREDGWWFNYNTVDILAEKV